ncbi:MAG: hypothetical protein INR72_19210, partial [Williamsia herbipolensis]|nr:hypothetical protein [Williamsia herbipolensis]
MALRRACTLATTTVLATGLLTAAVMTPAAAAPTAVEVETVADQLVDRDGATLWLAGSKGVGYGTSPVGRTLIDGTAGAHSLAQAADGTVYASSDHALTRIAADHSVTTVAAGEYDCLGDVAVTTGAVWVVSACDDTHPQLVRIADGTVTADAVTVDEPGSMRLASASGAPDELVVSDHVSTDVQDEDGTHSTVVPRVRVLDTTGAAPVQKFVTTLTPSDAAPVLALSRDGSRLVAGVDADFRMFDVRTQSTAGVRLPAYGETVASAGVSDDGRFAALVTLSTNAAFVLVYAADGTRLTSHGYGVDSAGVAWQGSALAVVTHQATADSDSLVILPTAYRNRPEVYLRDQDVRAYWGQRITVIGDAITDTGDPARGLRLTVSRSGPDGTRTLGTTTVGASGQFSWNDTAPVAGTFRYKF